MSELHKRTLTEWLDDLCVRFIINLPQEELESVERICFQVEEAQWFYEDFVRPLDPTLPSMNLKKFCMVIFQHCPLLSEFSQYHHFAAFSEFLAYKQRVPVRGAIMLNDSMDQVVLVKGWKKGARWSFPRGKINKDESDLDCAIREVYEETGYDLHEAGLAGDPDNAHAIEVSMREQHMKLFVFRDVPMDTEFEPRTRKEISKISWYKLSELPTLKQARQHQNGEGGDAQHQSGKFYMVAPFLGPLKHWIRQQKKRDKLGVSATTMAALPTDDEQVARRAISEVEATLRREELVDTGSGHFNNLLAGLRASSGPDERTMPELAQLPTPTADPAAALKRMLSVGQDANASLPLSAPLEASHAPNQPAPDDSRNVLLGLLRNGPNPSPYPVYEPAHRTPMTPLDQITTAPIQPRTPPHHHHIRPHPIPPLFLENQPPQLPYPAGFEPSHQQAQQVSIPLLAGQTSLQPPLPQSQRRPEHTSQLLSLFRSNAREDGFGAPINQIQMGSGSPMPLHNTRPTTQTTNVVPQPSKLPAPKLTAHTISLLNAFKSPTPSQSVPTAQSQGQLSELSASDASPPTSMPSLHAYRIPPATGTSSNTTLPQQASLLGLFHRSPKAPQDHGQGPAELAAKPSPHPSSHHEPPRSAKPGLELQTAAMKYQDTQSMTSATVTGPLHSPNLTFLRRHIEPSTELSNDSENTPRSHYPPSTTAWGATAPSWLPAERRLSAVQALSPASAAPEVARPIGNPEASPFDHHYHQSKPENIRSVPPGSGQTDRTGSVSIEQKDALLSLLTGNPFNPGAAKQQTTSGVLSPVSPLPGSGKSKTSSTQGSPAVVAGVDAKSRVSSIASLAGNAMPGTLAPNSAAQYSLGVALPGSAQNSGFTHTQETTSKQGKVGSPSGPVDKSVLLGFLQNVAKGA